MTNMLEAALEAATRFREEGRNREAIAAYQRVLALQPALPDTWYNLGLALRAEARFDESLDAYAEALRRGVEAPEEVHLNRSVILADHLRRDGDAEAELRAALAANPDYAPAWLNLGNLLEERGDREGAAAAYDHIQPADDGSIASHQDLRYEALARLAHLRPPTDVSDTLLAAIERAAFGRAIMGPETRANLCFSLGRALDNLGLYERAFAAFAKANECVRRAGPPYDRQAISRNVDAQCATFASAAKMRRPKDRSPQPVFICGMFRSGSTLVEQVLAGHRLIIAGGELNLLDAIASRLPAPYPQSIRTLTEERAGVFASAYCKDLRALFPQSCAPGMIVTDKRPDNFLRIGLIKTLFPDARIIHTVRNPIDTCLSVFFQHIDQRVAGYASDLGDCAHYFGEYRRLMAHWKSLYSADIFDFDYDIFVHEPQSVLTQLFGFLELQPDEKCLEFHKLTNAVKTASYWQVRRPLYTDASGRRRNYRNQIATLETELAKAGVEVD